MIRASRSSKSVLGRPMFSPIAGFSPASSLSGFVKLVRYRHIFPWPSLARSLSRSKTALARLMLSHWVRSLGLQDARRSIALSARRSHPASSSLCSNKAARRLNSLHSEDCVILSCMVQSASISCRIFVSSCSSLVIAGKHRAIRAFISPQAPVSQNTLSGALG